MSLSIADKIISKANEILTKELGHKPTSDELLRFFNINGYEIVGEMVKLESNPLREALDDIYDPKCPSCSKPTKHGERCAPCYQDYLDHLKDVREDR